MKHLKILGIIDFLLIYVKHNRKEKMKEKFPDPCKAKPNDIEKQRIQENAIIFKKGKEKLGADFQVGESSKTAPDRRVENDNR